MRNLDSLYGRRSTYDTTFMSKVYLWMSLALCVTGAVSLFVASTPEIAATVASSTVLLILLFLVEIGIVFYLVSQIDEMSFENAFWLFFVYAGVNGITLSIIFLIYTASSIALTFFVTAGMFGVMSLYGLTTKQDLSSWGNFLFMALIGLIIAGLVNMFMQSPVMDYIISFVGVLVFTAYTAYDTQKIKELSGSGNMKYALIGALKLYLDFINLFLYLLRFLGKRD